MDNAFMTIEQVAKGLKVFPKDVLQWVSEGKLKAISEGGTHLIPVEEYQKYGQSFPPELRAKLGEYLWHTQLLIAPEIEKDVADRFRTNTRIVLQRDKIAITLLETIHKKYEPQIDIFNDKRGYVATFILYARIISLLNSIVLLLESGVPSESFLLLRPLWEAALLAEYFALSEINHENEQQIRRYSAMSTAFRMKPSGKFCTADPIYQKPPHGGFFAPCHRKRCLPRAQTQPPCRHQISSWPWIQRQAVPFI